MKVLGEFRVNLHLADEARSFISDLLEGTDIPDPILGIGWGRWNDEKEDRWLLGLYSRARCTGWLCTTKQFEFVVINPNLVERLDGRTLDIVRNRPTVH
jgi:hypothetical protein